ncbi:hypothetical protein GF1_30040 [Desulfolithobacter dissulfuricans]|uniref:RNA-directed DNA polymerase n=1 Tax=Desulfolithobacter dissulfuricans TaxID=2795293 RepID=A0A915U3J5_9BACT|nr:retron Ec67 family RNA-directed DNA polymerase/endonuclease [Desulfolithobacter dissulfuricans]BCO10628.1 hypothetical protein GF1_30040 [Desulfolithobacter dissulfuricans]
MSSLEKLKQTNSLSDLAKLIGYKPNSLAYIIYKIPNEKKYIEFKVPKKTGGERIIKSPTSRLKKLQRRVADLLNDCLEEILSENKHSLSHGFRRNHSIISNAQKHVKKRHVFNVDLKDFFPSINFGRVRGFFIKNHHFKLKPKIATILAQIACHNNELPQGSPCSPVISNLIGHLIDIRMVNLAKRAKCTYSRYADDLTFSTNKKEFPNIIAVRKENGSNIWIPSRTLVNEIKKIGFEVNESKTSLQYKTSRQITTGLIVNKKVNIKKEYYRMARAMCNELFATNEFYLKSDIDGEEAKKGTVNQLIGIVNFIYYVKRLHDKRKLNERHYNPSSITKLYRRLLFYKYFYALKCPLLICEGKTDIIYLRCALKQLAKDFPTLIEKKDEKYNFNIAFLKFSKQLRDVFAIAKGTSGLCRILEMYPKIMSKFYAPGKVFPVIIIIDNDDGASKINSILQNKYKINNHCNREFNYICDNLYVVHIPSLEGQNVSIESLFNPELLKTKIDGKIFNPKSYLDKKKEYSKTVFAEKVVRMNQNDIDFTGFKPLFNRIELAIQNYTQINAEHLEGPWLSRDKNNFEAKINRPSAEG